MPPPQIHVIKKKPEKNTQWKNAWCQKTFWLKVKIDGSSWNGDIGVKEKENGCR